MLGVLQILAHPKNRPGTRLGLDGNGVSSVPAAAAGDQVYRLRGLSVCTSVMPAVVPHGARSLAWRHWRGGGSPPLPQ